LVQLWATRRWPALTCRSPGNAVGEAQHADPRHRATGAFLSLHNILPVRYPLDDAEPADMLDAENFLGHLLDYGVILPRAHRLYEHAAHDLDRPALLDLIHDRRPAYAWRPDDTNVWLSHRSPRTRQVLARLVR
jgi:hypothetical protein